MDEVKVENLCHNKTIEFSKTPPGKINEIGKEIRNKTTEIN